ncbi:hypothetical protein H3V02_02700 [Bifidobacterium sp. W8106]|uniref:hypothetical protein n=1 Tax=Bifidobacterium TaxID=1678 RepID=UPI0018DD8426|nr:MULTISPECIES: hypothetical protein [Bifidobacterium]MBI0142088.1 hypothetical protein [Bifidobacterium choladohabitans]MBI0146893.1 hypothetical protein [Bifidobacterium sp. W8104]MBI0150765.1 hypothetical protein [Bifidobacterium sp. M0353]
MIQAMRMRHMFVPFQPRIGSFWATVAIGPAFIDIIDYLLLLLIPAETMADCGLRRDGGGPRARSRIGRSERRVALA